ncbi:MAG: hypothetical protein J6D52_00185 [Clostridia bacterium]|nr:hypothetical protein [Clostridia bacterium]
MRIKDLFDKTCKDCGKVFKTDRKNAYICPTCKKLKKAEVNKRQCAEVRGVKIKPRAENKYERETDALVAFVRLVDRYNKEHGTRYSYGQFENALHNRKIRIAG